MGGAAAATTAARSRRPTRATTAAALLHTALLLDCSRTAVATAATATAAARRSSVLLFAVDDLRAEFGSAYQAPEVRTPHLDALTSRDGAVTFRRSYVQYAHCVVSRASILSGRRPGYTSVRTGVPFGSHPNNNHTSTPFSAEGTTKKKSRGDSCARGWGNYTTLPSYFRQQGWVTAGGGKVFHPDTCDGASLGEDRYAWSLPYYHAPCFQWGSLPCRGTKSDPQNGTGCGVASWMANETAADEQVPDGMIANNAIEQLGALRATGMPWFLAVGLHKPHLPHFAPKKYFDMYTLEDISLPTPSHPPAGLGNSSALVFANGNGNHELWEYDDVAAGWPGDQYDQPNVLLPEVEVRRQRLAYFAVVSFVDAQIGKVVAAVDAGTTTSKDAPIMGLFGDHGWHLGEQNHWAKCTNFDHAVHAPLIFVLPPHLRAQPASFLTITVEAVSLFPTLVDLAQLPPLPRCPPPSPISDRVKLCADGLSLAPLLLHGDSELSAEHAALANGTLPAYSQWAGGHAMGFTMRTDRFRYTEWVNHTTALFPDWANVLARELYDHVLDPHEAVNVAADPTQAANLAALSRKLHEARGNSHPTS